MCPRLNTGFKSINIYLNAAGNTQVILKSDKRPKITMEATMSSILPEINLSEPFCYLKASFSDFAISSLAISRLLLS